MSAFLEIPAAAPRTLVFDPPLSDEEFEKLCQANDAFLERTKEGIIRMNAPAGGSSSSGNNEISRQLGNWWIRHRRGRVFDSSGGFFLQDGSVLSPDASYITAEQAATLTRDDLAHSLRLAPAFIIELRSPSDRLAEVQQKMEDWIANGVQLGWLIDPEARQAHVYRPGMQPLVESGLQIPGSGPIEGFVLDLEEVWRCYEV
ncbi:MAG TPA: Uma2 family endonuclease [Terracidiphilus sp.]|jgi:Uma2 family endonuclease|nr:Uma2 family endonuclease [Terracidiphilus sp.]